MSITTVKTNSANAQIKAEISNESIAKRVDKIVKNTAKNLKVDGFRKGKVPVSIVKSRYADKLTQDAQGEALRELINNGISELEIKQEDIIGEPKITKFDEGEESISVEVTLDVKPTIDLGDYKSLIPEFTEEEASDEEVEERLNELAKAQAPLKDLEEDRGLENGDYSVINFEGFLNGEAFEGGKAEDFNLQIGSGQFIPGFEEQLVGMKKGEEKTINVTFPENYNNKDLAGKETQFDVKVVNIQTKGEVELNDELAKTMMPNEENPTIDGVREKIKAQIKTEKMSKLYNEDLKPKFLDILVEKIEVDLPNSVVDQEVGFAINNKAREMSEDEIKELQNSKEKIEELKNELLPDAQKSVKATFIIDSLAKAEAVDVSENELMQTLYYEAMQMRQDPQQIIKYYQDNNLLPAVKMSMIEDKVITKLFDEKLKA
jgi:trigger factor